MVVIQTQLLDLVINRINSVDLADVSEVQFDYFWFWAFASIWARRPVLLLRVVPCKQLQNIAQLAGHLWLLKFKILC